MELYSVSNSFASQQLGDVLEDRSLECLLPHASKIVHHLEPSILERTATYWQALTKVVGDIDMQSFTFYLDEYIDKVPVIVLYYFLLFFNYLHAADSRKFRDEF